MNMSKRYSQAKLALKLKKKRKTECLKKQVVCLLTKYLSEAISLDSKTMKFNGFVNLGDYTPDDQKNIRGNHALVFMFQPFRKK